MADFTDLLSGFGTTPPEYLGGLLGQDAVENLKKQAMGTGIINTALAYLAAPKNQNLGLGRIVGQSLMAGQQGAQGVYTGALSDWETQQKVADMKRQQDQKAKLDTMLAGITDPNERLYAQIAPQEYVAGKLKPQTKAFQLLNTDQAKAYNLPTAPNGQAWQVSEKGFELVGATPKDNWGEPYTLNGQTVQKDSVTGKIRQAVTQPSSTVTNVQNFTPAATQLQKSAAESLQKNYDILQNVPQTLATMEQAKKLVPEAANFVGNSGQMKLDFAKFLNNNFGTNIDTNGIASAEELRSALFSNVMDNLKKMDASPTEQQQAVMAKAFGTLDTDPKALPRIIDMYENILRDKVKIHNTRVDQISKKIDLPYDIKVNLPDIIPATETPQQRIDRIKSERKAKGGKNNG